MAEHATAERDAAVARDRGIDPALPGMPIKARAGGGGHVYLGIEPSRNRRELGRHNTETSRAPGWEP